MAAASTRARRNLTTYACELVEDGRLEVDGELLAHVFWAQLHGLISLQMAGQLGPDQPGFEAIRHEMVRRILHSARLEPASAGRKAGS